MWIRRWLFLDLGIFLRELRSLRKIPRPKTITSDFHTMTSKKMVRSYYCLIQNVWIAVINDNNYFAPSLFRSLCEFIGVCFGPRYFSSGAVLRELRSLRKIPRSKTITSDFTQWPQKKMMRSYYCLIKPLGFMLLGALFNGRVQCSF